MYKCKKECFNLCFYPLEYFTEYCSLTLLADGIIQIECDEGYKISDDTGVYRCVTDSVYNPKTLPTCNGEFLGFL